MKISRYILSGLFTILALFFCSCEEETSDSFEAVKKGKLRQGEVNFTTLIRLHDGLEDGVLSRIDFKMYNNDEQTGGKWEFFDHTDYVGLSPVTPGTVIISGGKVWMHVETFSCSEGPTYFAQALSAVNKTLKRNYGAYVAHNFAVDQDTKSFSIGDTQFGIVASSTNSLKLSFISDYLGGRTHKGGQHLEVSTYKLAEPFIFDSDRLRFDSTYEAYEWLIDIFRATFGEEVNLNQIYAGLIILDQPILSIDKLIAERDRKSASD